MAAKRQIKQPTCFSLPPLGIKKQKFRIIIIYWYYISVRLLCITVHLISVIRRVGWQLHSQCLFATTCVRLSNMKLSLQCKSSDKKLEMYQRRFLETGIQKCSSHTPVMISPSCMAQNILCTHLRRRCESLPQNLFLSSRTIRPGINPNVLQITNLTENPRSRIAALLRGGGFFVSRFPSSRRISFLEPPDTNINVVPMLRSSRTACN